MSDEELRTRLERMVAHTNEPVLSTEEVDSLLEIAIARGINIAAAEGWRWKAGKAASDFNMAVDNVRFDRAQVYQACVAQAKLYADRGVGVMTVASSTAEP